MSFFDDEGDEPPTRSARPRRPAGPRAARAGGPHHGGPPSDNQQLMLRRAGALAGGVIVVILLVLLVNGCLDSRAKDQLRSYNRDVNSIVTVSNQQVSKPLFDLLNSADGDSTLSLTQGANRILSTAQEDLRRAEALSVPDDMRQAHQHLLTALSLRAEGVEKIASDLRDIGGDQKRRAVNRIAGSMRLFLASDVLFSQRIDPYIDQALKEREIGNQDIVPSQFLPDDSWLAVDTVGDRLGVAGAASSSGQATAGTHGHGLVSVKIGTTTLQPAPAANRVSGVTTAPTLTVDFQNQGENDEFDVVVRVSGPSITPVTKRVDQTKAGEAATAQVRLNGVPPLNTPVRLKVEVQKVTGEKTTSNNSEDFTVTFER